ncbi:beta-2-microglobulin-like [Anguilla rostrata]|uniref:beta-2-microglobulin-like n=1 Tax=Anguilla rostrata TaxID=7938 RepID=UPI0030D33731
MKLLLCLAVFAIALISVNGVHSAPKVQVYSRNPGMLGVRNKLICHVSGFHPPDIKIQLMENGQEIPNAVQTDLAFEQTWQFHLTRSVDFTPVEGKEYSCVVKHQNDPAKPYQWEPDM